jgi:exonuclease SbcD
MVVKIVFLADTHLGFDYSLRPEKERQRRGGDFFSNFDKVLNYAKKINADLLIHGGDLFFRTKVPQPIVDMVYERIFRFAQTGIPMVIVPGNHESSKLPTSLFLQHPNIFYFTQPQVFKFKVKNQFFDIAGFPCVRNGIKTKFPEILKEIQPHLNTESIKLLCMHQSIEGAKVGPSDFTFRYGDDVIPIKNIPTNYNLILSGHIHRAQILWATNKTPVIYPGSIERTSFAEKDEEKGFYEIEFDEAGSLSYKFISLKTRPMIDIFLKKENYSTQGLKDDITTRISKVPINSVIRFKMLHKENLPLLSIRLLDELLPSTINYQISGLKEFYAN